MFCDVIPRLNCLEVPLLTYLNKALFLFSFSGEELIGHIQLSYRGNKRNQAHLNKIEEKTIKKGKLNQLRSSM